MAELLPLIGRKIGISDWSQYAVFDLIGGESGHHGQKYGSNDALVVDRSKPGQKWLCISYQGEEEDEKVLNTPPEYASYVDPTTGKTFYHVSAISPDLEHYLWEAVKGKESSEVHFVNVRTKEMRWNLPAATEELDDLRYSEGAAFGGGRSSIASSGGHVSGTGRDSFQSDGGGTAPISMSQLYGAKSTSFSVLESKPARADSRMSGAETPDLGNRPAPSFAHRSSSNFQEFRVSDDVQRHTIQRTDLEDMIEEQLFTSEGGGEIHVLCAVKCVFMVYPAKKKKLDNVVFVVVRDWCGAYAVYILKSTKNKFKGTIQYAFPLLQGFMVTAESKGKDDTWKMSLNVDDIHMDIECNYFSKLTILHALALSFDEMALNRNEVEVLTMRLASVEFVGHTRQAEKLVDKPDEVKKLLKDALDSSDNEKIVLLRRSLYQSEYLELVTQGVMDSLAAHHTKSKSAQVLQALMVLESALASPSPLSPATILALTEVLLKIGTVAGAWFITADIATFADQILQDLKLLQQALSMWEGRMALGDVTFPAAFFGTGTSDPMTPGRSSVKKSKRESFGKSVFKAGGLYVCCLFYTGEKLLLDKNGDLPAVLMNDAAAEDFVELSSNWKWLNRLPNPIPEPMHAAREEIEAHPVRGEFLQAVRNLKQQMGVPDLGRIYEYPVPLEETTSTLLMTVKKYHTEQKISGFVWVSAAEAEHRYYQRYMNVAVSARLDRLPNFPKGPRFMQSCRDFYESYQSPISNGVYIGFVLALSSLRGFEVMVQDSRPTMVPCVRIADNISKEQWLWVQGVRLRAAEGVPMLTSETSGSEGSFPQRFSDGLQMLKRDLGLDDLGALYDHEIINVDEKNGIKLILYSTLSSSFELPEHLRDRYSWKHVDALEQNLFVLYNKHAFTEYQRSLLRVYSSDANTKYSGMSIQAVESAKKQKRNVTMAAQSKERIWNPMRWLMRIITWNSQGMLPITHSVTVKHKKTTREILDEAVKNSSRWHIRARNVLLEMLDDKKSLDDAEIKMQELDQQLQEEGYTELVEDETDFMPEIRPQKELEVTNVPFDDFDIAFALGDLLPAGRAYSPLPVDICEFLVEEIVEEALVVAVDGEELVAIERCVRDVVDLVELMDEMVTDVVVFGEQIVLEGNFEADRMAFDEALSLLFRQPLPEYIDDADEQESLVIGLFETDATPVAPYIRAAAQDFGDLVHLVEKCFGAIDSLEEVAVVGHLMDELSTAVRVREKKGRRRKKPSVLAQAKQGQGKSSDRMQSMEQVPVELRGHSSAKKRRNTTSTASTASTASSGPKQPPVVKVALSALVQQAAEAEAEGMGNVPPSPQVFTPIRLPSSLSSGNATSRAKRRQRGESSVPGGVIPPAPLTAPKSLSKILDEETKRRQAMHVRRSMDLAGARLKYLKRTGDGRNQWHTSSAEAAMLAARKSSQDAPLSKKIGVLQALNELYRSSNSVQYSEYLQIQNGDVDHSRDTSTSLGSVDAGGGYPPREDGREEKRGGRGDNDDDDESATMSFFSDMLSEANDTTMTASRRSAPPRPAVGLQEPPPAELEGRGSHVDDEHHSGVGNAQAHPDGVLLVTGDNVEFMLPAELATRCTLIAPQQQQVYTFPDISSDVLQRVLMFLAGDFTSYTEILADKSRRLLSAASRLGIHELALMAAADILQTVGPSDELLTLLMGCCLVDMALAAWIKLEGAVPSDDQIVDVIWFARTMVQFNSGVPYASQMHHWKQTYCESLVQSRLTAGDVALIDVEELELWSQSIGQFVKVLDLSDSPIGDDALSVLVAYCPNLKLLDLHNTNVTDGGLFDIVENCKFLGWVNASSTAVSAECADELTNMVENLEVVVR